MQIVLSQRAAAQYALFFNECGVLLGVQMRSPFHCLLGTNERRNEETLGGQVPNQKKKGK